MKLYTLIFIFFYSCYTKNEEKKSTLNAVDTDTTNYKIKTIPSDYIVLGDSIVTLKKEGYPQLSYKFNLDSSGDFLKSKAWYNLGGAFFNTQNYIMAKSSWERALQINPNYTEVKKVLPMVTPELISISQDNIVISSGIESVKQISDKNQIILKDKLNKIYNKKKIEINYSVSSYDSEGNWIKKIILINGKSEGLTERKIKYYK